MELANSNTKLSYRLSNPGYTIYHRAALGGLAASVIAWDAPPASGMTASVTRDSVELGWPDDLSDQDALKAILGASFKLTPDKMIHIPGHGIPSERPDLLLAVHNGIVQTFLQHPKSRPGEKEPRKFLIQTADEEESLVFTYKALHSYAHQTAQKTGLLDEKNKGRFPTTATITQSIVPGALTGSTALEANADEVILLLFLVAGCSVFHLRSKYMEAKAQSCLILPDVVDLVAFTNAVERVVAAGSNFKMFSNSLLGRHAGGAEEAALRFVIDLHTAQSITSERSISGCQAIAMGKVAWDANQVNRSRSIRVRDDYPEMGVFRSASEHLSRSRARKNEKGASYVMVSNSIPELVAANLANEQYWCSGFSSLVGQKKDFDRLNYLRGGLVHMKNAIRDADDVAVIDAFHDAWRGVMGGIYERAKRDGLNPERLLEVERERVRNAILRAKTAESLAGWFLRFCAEGARTTGPSTIKKEASRIRTFIFTARNFERFQNLCLFALVSYESKTAVGGGK